MGNQEDAGIVAFGFGEPAKLIPNEEIAKRATSLILEQDASVVYTDRDVAPHMKSATALVIELDPEKFPSTWCLSLLAVEGTKKAKLTTMYVVAARCHIWRCLRDLRWAADELGVVVELIPQTIEGDQYDPAAITWFTRSAWVWWPMETIYRVGSTISPKWYKKTRTFVINKLRTS